MFGTQPRKGRPTGARDWYCQDCRSDLAQELAARRPFPNPNDLSGETSLVKLTRGKFAVIDTFDTELVASHIWQARFDGQRWYAITTVTGAGGKRETVLMHRLIAGDAAPDIDHWDRDGLNNRRGNLRPATRSQNLANRPANRNNTSGFKGVYPVPSGRWLALIVVRGKRISLGLFTTQVEAAQAYDARARHEFGEFAGTNFDEDHAA